MPHKGGTAPFMPAHQQDINKLKSMPRAIKTKKPRAEDTSRSQNMNYLPRAVNSSENWEEEIDEFGSEVFHVKLSFFRSGTR